MSLSLLNNKQNHWTNTSRRCKWRSNKLRSNSLLKRKKNLKQSKL